MRHAEPCNRTHIRGLQLFKFKFSHLTCIDELFAIDHYVFRMSHCLFWPSQTIKRRIPTECIENENDLGEDTTQNVVVKGLTCT